MAREGWDKALALSPEDAAKGPFDGEYTGVTNDKGDEA